LLAPGAADASAFLTAADAAATTAAQTAAATALRAAVESTRPTLETIDAALAALRTLASADGPAPVNAPVFTERLDDAERRLLATYRDRLVAASDAANADKLGPGCSSTSARARANRPRATRN
jgi:hypothetical protein